MYDQVYLQHHGVKGMKWGVRKDRTGRVSPRKKLNPLQKMVRAGKKRRAAGAASRKKEATRQAQEQQQRQHSTKSSPVQSQMHSMTTQELKERLDRLELEKKYSTLMAEMNKKPKNKALAFIGPIVSKSVEEVGKAYLTDMLKKQLGLSTQQQQQQQQQGKK